MPFPRAMLGLTLSAVLIAGLGWAVADDAPAAGRAAPPASPQEQAMPAAKPPAPTAQAPSPRTTPATPAAKVVLRTATFAAG